MAARLASVPSHSAWNVTDALHSVEQRCLELLSPLPRCEVESFDSATRAATHHFHAGGRRIRAQLALHAAQQLNLSERTAVAIASASELLHNASLIHDDLQDRDTHRRGVPAVWKLFGDEVAVCSGDLLLSAAYAALAQIDDPTCLAEMIAAMHRGTAAAIRGQSADVAHRNTPVEDLATYLQIAAGKSGALLGLPLELALLAAHQKSSCAMAREAAEAFSIGYQIADDLDDLESDAETAELTSKLNVGWLLLRIDDIAEQSSNRDRQLLRRKIHQDCVDLACRHLAQAIDCANLLPQQCGLLMVDLATRQAAQLQDAVLRTTQPADIHPHAFMKSAE